MPVVREEQRRLSQRSRRSSRSQLRSKLSASSRSLSRSGRRLNGVSTLCSVWMLSCALKIMFLQISFWKVCLPETICDLLLCMPYGAVYSILYSIFFFCSFFTPLLYKLFVHLDDKDIYFSGSFLLITLIAGDIFSLYKRKISRQFCWRGEGRNQCLPTRLYLLLAVHWYYKIVVLELFSLILESLNTRDCNLLLCMLYGTECSTL